MSRMDGKKTHTHTLSIIVPPRHTGIGAWVDSKLYTSILFNFINCHARVLYKHRIHEKLGLQLSLLHYIYDQMGV